MSQALIERIRAARAVRIELNGMVFFARRPTIEDYACFAREGMKDTAFCTKYVSGWENVRACDLMPGAGTELVDYDAALFAEALPDSPILAGTIVKQLTVAVLDALAKATDTAKNSPAGLNSAH